MGACSDAKKVTVMILNVDLDCCQCYRKVKKLLCKFHQIRDQVYDEKQNTVTITVICCSPEKIKEKICSKGGKSIKSIAIKESKKLDSEKPKDKAKAKSEDKPKTPAAAAEPEKHKQQAAAEPKSKSADEQKPPAPEKSKKSVSWAEPEDGKKSDSSKKESSGGPKANAAPKSADSAPAPAPAKILEPEAQWVPGYPPGPPHQVLPVTVYHGGGSGYQGVPAAGPFYQGQGYGYPYAHQPCPPGPGYYDISHSDYFTDENPTACSIM